MTFVQTNWKHYLDNLKNAPKIENSFYGRSNELKLLHKKLNGKIKRTVLVSGLPGIGKTQFALAYLQNYGSNYSQIFWINGESEYTITQSLIRFKEQYNNFHSIDEIIQDESKNLSNGKILIVFDNVSEIKRFYDTFPNVKDNKDVNFIITSRNCDEDGWKNMEMLHLDVLLKEEAQKVVESKLENFQTSAIETLVEKLQCYPLILQQAVAYILGENISIEKCLTVFNENPQIVFQYQLSKDCNDYDKTVYDIFYDIINKLDVEKETLEILSILSHLAPEKISIEFLYDGEFNKMTVDGILKKLYKFSLVKKENDSIKVNDIAQSLIRIYIEQKNKTTKALERVDIFLENIHKKSDESEYGLLIAKEAIPHVEFFSKHLEEMCAKSKNTDLSKIKFEYLINAYEILTWLYYYVKKYHSRRALLLKYIELMTEKKGAENSQSIEVARLKYYLAFTEYAVKKNKPADDLYKEAFVIFEKQLGVDNLETANLLRNWADCKCSMKKYTEADSLNEKVKAIYEKELGEDHLNMAILLSEMAKSKSRQGKHQEADSLFQKSMDIFDQSVNGDSIQMIHMLNQWARHDFEKRDFRRAYEKFERCRPVYERNYGKNHSSTKRVQWYLEDAKKRVGSIYASPKINRTSSLSREIPKENVSEDHQNKLLTSLKIWLKKKEDDLRNNKIGESLFTVEKSLLYLNRINEEIESKKNDFDMLQKAKENESDDIFKFRKNVKKLTERYEQLSNLTNEYIANLKEVEFFFKRKMYIENEIARREKELGIILKKLESPGTVHVRLLTLDEVNIIQEQLDSMENVITRQKVMANLKYLTQKLTIPDESNRNSLQNQIHKLQNKCNKLISEIIQCKTIVTDLKNEMENETIINKFSLWIDKTSELLLKKETYEKVNSPNILKNLLDVLQIELNEKIEETNNMKYKFESSQIYDIEKKLQRLQTILDRKNDFFRYKDDCATFENWIEYKLKLVSTTDCGTDVETVNIILQSFKIIESEINEKYQKYDNLTDQKNRIIRDNTLDVENVEKIFSRMETLWTNLLNLKKSRKNDLQNAGEFYKICDDIDLMVKKFFDRYSELFSEIFGNPLELCSIKVLIDKYNYLENEMVDVVKQVDELKLKADIILSKFPDIVGKIRKTIQNFKKILSDIPEKKEQLQQAQKYFEDFIALSSWIEEMMNKIKQIKSINNITDANNVIEFHKSIKNDIEYRQASFFELYSIGENLIKQKHFLAEGVNSSMSSLRSYYSLLKTTWKKRNELYKNIYDRLVKKDSFSNDENQKRISTILPMIDEAIGNTENGQNASKTDSFLTYEKLFENLKSKEKIIDEHEKKICKSNEQQFLIILKNIEELLKSQLEELKIQTAEKNIVKGGEVNEALKSTTDNKITINNDQNNNNQIMNQFSSSLQLNTTMTALILMLLTYLVHRFHMYEDRFTRNS